VNSHFLAWALSTPWALQPDRMAAYAAVLARRYAGGIKAERDADGRPGSNNMGGEGPDVQAAVQRAGAGRRGAIAVVPIRGAIFQRASQIDICDGGTGTDKVSQALREANADDTVDSILLDIDSPGGSVYGVAELAAEIRASAKPVTAIANSLAASAGYWLGSAAGEFYVTPGGEVGSIGVWMAHEDWSKALEEFGIKTTLISAGQYKTEGNPYEPLGDDARAFLQSRTDDYYSAFTRDVAKGRKVSVEQVRNGMGQGRVLGAAQAKAEGMVDGVMTFDEVVRHMSRNAAPAGRKAESQRTAQQLALLSLQG
jgi:signal peptide peptidase SppA